MRLMVHIAVFLLSCAALANSLFMQMKVKTAGASSQARISKEVQMRTGSLVIYKTTPDVVSSHVRRTADMPWTGFDGACAVGVCQDV